MNKYLTFLIFIAFTLSSIIAQVDIEISDGMTVETSGSLSIEVSGDVIENGTGYLNGVVTSGTRSAVTSFAGLNLTNPLNGIITRTTGTALIDVATAADPKTFKRHYNINNQSGSAFTAIVDINYLSSGSNDETNGILTPFIYRRVGSSWVGYQNNTTSPNTASAASVIIPTNFSDLTVAEGIGVGARIFLEGPYAGASSMSTTINGIIPPQSPYIEAPRTASSVPATAVDWVLVSLRDNTSPFAVQSSHSAFVNGDGYLIDDSGTVLNTAVPETPGSFRISIKHRNHLEVMTNTNQSLTWESN